jgi:hypothetical protein
VSPGPHGLAADTDRTTRPRPIVLVVLDGFGIGHDPAADAIAAARMPTWRSLVRDWPHATLGASEEAVGLPPGQMGNSEVGHLNLGSGRPVLQDLPRIDAAIAEGSFDTTPALLEACQRATRPGGRLHIVSLVGPGGVHANDRHLVALVELAARLHVPSVRVHALLDGRDTPPRSALGFVADLERRIVATPQAVASHRLEWTWRVGRCSAALMIGLRVDVIAAHHTASPFRAAMRAIIQASISDSIHALRTPWSATGLGKASCAIRR